jgi:hypothetical protein
MDSYARLARIYNFTVYSLWNCRATDEWLFEGEATPIQLQPVSGDMTELAQSQQKVCYKESLYQIG